MPRSRERFILDFTDGLRPRAEALRRAILSEFFNWRVLIMERLAEAPVLGFINFLRWHQLDLP
jgi:hypothetical protein